MDLPQTNNSQLNGELVTIATFRDLSEALLAKGKLEDAGIICFLTDDNIVRMDWFWANAVGGVKLNVAEADAPAAAELLFGAVEVEPGSEAPPILACPKCGSHKIALVDPDRGFRLFALWAIGLPTPRMEPLHWECADCGAKWVEEDDGKATREQRE